MTEGPIYKSEKTFWGISRRQLLFSGLAAAGAVVLENIGFSSAGRAEESDTTFLWLSGFLTGTASVNPVMSARYAAALNHYHAGFQQRMSKLVEEIKSSGAQTMDAWLGGSPSTDSHETARIIVAAWYTGVVGNDSGRELIAYAEALMYRPTKGALIFPTYGIGPLAWGDMPQVQL